MTRPSPAVQLGLCLAGVSQRSRDAEQEVKAECLLQGLRRAWQWGEAQAGWGRGAYSPTRAEFRLP